MGRKIRSGPYDSRTDSLSLNASIREENGGLFQTVTQDGNITVKRFGLYEQTRPSIAPSSLITPIIPTEMASVWVSGLNMYGWLGTGQDYTLVHTQSATVQRTYIFDTVLLINYAPGYFEWASEYTWSEMFNIYGTMDTEPSNAWIIIPGAHPASVDFEGNNYVFASFVQHTGGGYFLDPYGTQNRRPLVYYTLLYNDGYYDQEEETTLTWPTEIIQKLNNIPKKYWVWQSHDNQVSFILNSVGGMYCCGSNERGALGIGEVMGEEEETGYGLPAYYSTTFREVPGLWKMVITNDNHTYALQTDGTLWHTGRYGNNQRNEFTCISDDNWESLVYDSGYFLVVKKIITEEVISYNVYAILSNNSLYFYETLTDIEYADLIESYNPFGGFGDEYMWIG